MKLATMSPYLVYLPNNFLIILIATITCYRPVKCNNINITSSSPISRSNEELTNYGERLAESSFAFTSTFSREPKDESNIYSSGINAILNSDGFLNQMEKLGNNVPKYAPQGPVEMAVHSKKTVEVIPVKFEESTDGEPQIIEISPYEVPVSIVFKTQTNKLHVNQEHKTEPAEEVKEINSEEEPHRVVHNVYRPVIQEVTEVVQPFRKVIQKVEPVIEEMKTIISKAAPQDGSVQVQQPQQISNHQTLFGSSIGDINSRSTFGFSSSSSNNKKISPFSDFHLSPLPYGSEVVNKVAPAPLTSTSTSTSESDIDSYIKKSRSISHRFGSEIDSNANSNDEGNSSIAHLSKLEPILLDKEANFQYNDIIKQYIENLLSTKIHTTNQQQQNDKQNQVSKTNANSIKINVPMKNTPKMDPTFKKQNDENGSKNKNNNNKKFKVIKEFRISLNDIKKELSKNNPSIMMKPLESFSVSGIPTSVRQATSTIQEGDAKSTRMNRNNLIISSSQKNDLEKLGKFSHRSRMNMNNNINNNNNPLRSYHYINLKRYGDTPPSMTNMKHQSDYHGTQDVSRFHRRMLLEPINNNNELNQWNQQYYNRYNRNHPKFWNQNRFRLVRRFGIMY